MTPAAAIPPLAGRTVLIVEDRYLIAIELEDEVRRLGGAVAGPARNLREARELLAHGPVDLALLDVNLDGELVFPLAETLIEQAKPFILLTGYDEAVLPAKWRACPRLGKPVDPRALREEIAKLA